MNKHIQKLVFVCLYPAVIATAVPVTVTIENLAYSDPQGLYFTPVWTGFHNGSFDLFNPGSAAGTELETIAEVGDPGPLDSLFSSMMPNGASIIQNDPNGPGPGVFAPGGSGTFTIELDPANHRYMSYASMVIPSNDTFIANGDPQAAELFDAAGNFRGTQSWTVYGNGTYDAGTEVNNIANGPAFVMGQDGAAGAMEGATITMQAVDGLDDFIGVTTPPGTTIGEGLTSEPLFRITVAMSGEVVPVTVTIMNLAMDDPQGLYFTPVWTGFHDGSFDLFDNGGTAVASLETVAEVGDPSGLGAYFLSQYANGISVVQNNPGGPGPGVFAPGGLGSYNVALDPSQHRYMSYASMVIPSNDTFMGNDDAMAIELFDENGAFLGPRYLMVSGDQVWDAGTEVNDPTDGPAFVMGQDGAAGTSEGSTIMAQAVNGLDNFIGLTTPPGTTIAEALTTEPLLYIRIERERWGQYPVDGASGIVDTGDFLGLINVSASPWIWSYDLSSWIYFPEENINQNGGWTYILRP
ncbi:MAG: spondin domain-containing protein [Puniceicoccaceae bacterium]